jgi:hypothetical protein
MSDRHLSSLCFCLVELAHILICNLRTMIPQLSSILRHSQGLDYVTGVVIRNCTQASHNPSGGLIMQPDYNIPGDAMVYAGEQQTHRYMIRLGVRAFGAGFVRSIARCAEPNTVR